jgi:transposase
MSEVSKKNPDEIVTLSHEVDPHGASKEICNWLIENVESYIETEGTSYKIDLVIDDSVKTMPNLKALQSLFRVIPDEDGSVDDEKILHCRKALNEVVHDIFKSVSEEKDLLCKLFEKMQFYYGKLIINEETKSKALQIDKDLKELALEREKLPTEEEKEKFTEKIIEKIKEGQSLLKFEQFEGDISIHKFDYEAFDVGVSLKDPETKEIIKEYVVPEGFVVWFDINLNKIVNPNTIDSSSDVRETIERPKSLF